MCMASVTTISLTLVPVNAAMAAASSLVVLGVFKVAIRLLSTPNKMAAFLATESLCFHP